jgi:hypothetical protein
MPVAAISHLTAGRSQIGTSLSLHLFFATADYPGAPG